MYVENVIPMIDCFVICHHLAIIADWFFHGVACLKSNDKIIV